MDPTRVVCFVIGPQNRRDGEISPLSPPPPHTSGCRLELVYRLPQNLIQSAAGYYPHVIVAPANQRPAFAPLRRRRDRLQRKGHLL